MSQFCHPKAARQVQCVHPGQVGLVVLGSTQLTDGASTEGEVDTCYCVQGDNINMLLVR